MIKIKKEQDIKALGFTHCPKCNQRLHKHDEVILEDIDYYFLNLKFQKNNEQFYQTKDTKLKNGFNAYLKGFNKLNKHIRYTRPYTKVINGEKYNMKIEIKITQSSMLLINILDIYKIDKTKYYQNQNCVQQQFNSELLTIQDKNKF